MLFRSGELKYTSLSKNLSNKLLEDEQFWNIINTANKVLFQSYHRIYIYDKSNETFEVISSDSNISNMFLVDKQIYFQKMGEGLFLLKDNIPKLVSDNHNLKNSLIVNLLEQDDNLLAITQNKGAYIIKEGIVSPWRLEPWDENKSIEIFSSYRLDRKSVV